MKKNRNPIYSGSAEGICRFYDFQEFVHFDITQFLRSRGLDTEFDEEGLDYEDVNYRVYNFNLGFAIEYEFNIGNNNSEIGFIGNHPVCSELSNFFRLYRDAQERKN